MLNSCYGAELAGADVVKDWNFKYKIKSCSSNKTSLFSLQIVHLNDVTTSEYSGGSSREEKKKS